MGIRPIPRLVLLLLALAVLALGAAGCGRGDDDDDAGAGDTATAVEDTTTEEALSGDVLADGSSTVGPLTTAAAEAYREVQPDVNVEVGISGTGGGFERFCAGETDISDASRPIKDDEEAPICADAGITYVDYTVAIDALTVIVNPENDWATCLTTEQLTKIWAPAAEGKITNWNQVDPSYPDVPLTLAGPGTDSGTFDYFTAEINGEEGASRADYNASEDDNVIVQAVAGEKGALGYLGYTYYEENTDTLKAVEIDSGGGCVAPSAETAQDGTYTPLSRPLFIYVKDESIQTKPQVKGFVDYYLNNLDALAEVGAVHPRHRGHHFGEPRDARHAGGLARPVATSDVTAGAQPDPIRLRAERRRWGEDRRQGVPRPLRARLGGDDGRDHHCSGRPVDRVLPRGLDRGLLHRRPVGAALRARPPSASSRCSSERSSSPSGRASSVFRAGSGPRST